MKRLLLLRHAKSNWTDPRQADFDRSLNPRGKKACERMGPFLRDRIRPPDCVLCSPAARTCETWEQIAPIAGWSLEPRFEKGLYAASSTAIRDILAMQPDRVQSILIIGHNPALQDLAISLIGRGRAEQIERLAEKLPTCGFVEMEANVGSWPDMTPGRARLLHFATPRRLPPA